MPIWLAFICLFALGIILLVGLPLVIDWGMRREQRKRR